MSTYNRVVAADSSASLAPTVRERLATEMADPASTVGASLAGTFGPLPSGTPTVGQVPVVSTVSPLALGWDDGTGGATGIWQAARVAGTYSQMPPGVFSTGAPLYNWVEGFPVPFAEAYPFDRVNVECMTAVAGASINVGMYDRDSTGDGYSRIIDFGSFDLSATGLVELTLAGTIPAGNHWLVVNLVGTAGAQLRVVGVVPTFAGPLSNTSGFPAAGGNTLNGWRGNGTSLPTTITPNVPRYQSMPRIQLRRA